MYQLVVKAWDYAAGEAGGLEEAIGVEEGDRVLVGGSKPGERIPLPGTNYSTVGLDVNWMTKSRADKNGEEAETSAELVLVVEEGRVVPYMHMGASGIWCNGEELEFYTGEEEVSGARNLDIYGACEDKSVKMHIELEDGPEGTVEYLESADQFIEIYGIPEMISGPREAYDGIKGNGMRGATNINVPNYDGTVKVNDFYYPELDILLEKAIEDAREKGSNKHMNAMIHERGRLRKMAMNMGWI